MPLILVLPELMTRWITVAFVPIQFPLSSKKSHPIITSLTGSSFPLLNAMVPYTRPEPRCGPDHQLFD